MPLPGPRAPGLQRSVGVANLVRETEGAIGYVDVLHARMSNLAYGAVENKDSLTKDLKGKVYVVARPENVTAAAKELMHDLPEDLTFKSINRPGENSYPICAAAWAVCYQKQPAAKLKHVTEFLSWITHEGQLPASNAWAYSRASPRRPKPPPTSAAVPLFRSPSKRKGSATKGLPRSALLEERAEVLKPRPSWPAAWSLVSPPPLAGPATPRLPKSRLILPNRRPCSLPCRKNSSSAWRKKSSRSKAGSLRLIDDGGADRSSDELPTK